MKFAIAAYQNRIAAILETADRFVVQELTGGKNSTPRSVKITDNSPNNLLVHLQQNSVKYLICGAVSGWMQHLFEANGIQVFSWLTGEVDKIAEAFATENLTSPQFLMPGCRHRNRGQHGHSGRFQQTILNSNTTIQKGDKKMKIGISTSGTDLSAAMDPRFGRAQYFIIIDPETMEFQLIPNSAAQASHGAGIQAAQLMHDQGVTSVITGHVGPNAFQTLTAANIKIYQAIQGTVEAAVNALKNNSLTELSQAGPAHAGMRSAGGGGGRGQGMGGGGGMRRK